jgi:hypothetical protein
MTLVVAICFDRQAKFEESELWLRVEMDAISMPHFRCQEGVRLSRKRDKALVSDGRGGVENETIYFGSIDGFFWGSSKYCGGAGGNRF